MEKLGKNKLREEKFIGQGGLLDISDFEKNEPLKISGKSTPV
jgi:hypothetical protein